MRTCTWKDCAAEAEKPQLDRNGRKWADLCPSHDRELDDAIGAKDVKRIMRAWILANGGAKKLAGKM